MLCFQVFELDGQQLITAPGCWTRSTPAGHDRSKPRTNDEPWNGEFYCSSAMAIPVTGRRRAATVRLRWRRSRYSNA